MAESETAAELSRVENLVTGAGRGRAPGLVPRRPGDSPVSPGPRITVMCHVVMSQVPGAETNVVLAPGSCRGDSRTSEFM